MKTNINDDDTDTDSERETNCTSELPFEDVPFDFDTSDEQTSVLCELVTVSATTTVAAARELRQTGYDRTENRCPDNDCNGRLWVNAIGAVCDTCAICVDDESDLRSLNNDSDGTNHTQSPQQSYLTDPWQQLWTDRPTYRSGIRKCVGGMARYDWYDTDDLPGSRGLDSLDPRHVYRSE